MFFWNSTWKREAVLCHIKLRASLFAAHRQWQVEGWWWGTCCIFALFYTKSSPKHSDFMPSHRGWNNMYVQKLLMTKHLSSVTFLYLLHMTLDSPLPSTNTLLCKSLTLQPGDETRVFSLLALIENCWRAKLLQKSLFLSTGKWSTWFLKRVAPWRLGLLLLLICCVFLQKVTVFEPPGVQPTESLLLLPLGEEGISWCMTVEQHKAHVTFRVGVLELAPTAVGKAGRHRRSKKLLCWCEDANKCFADVPFRSLFSVYLFT